jgi:outer membrane protein assembly factor BamB
LVYAEHWSKMRKKWVRSWRIVAPNSIMSPPIVLGPRLCYAGLDDRVTCVRASNGHRLWAVDLGDRLSRGITCWPACGGPTVDGEVLLVVPDDGASVIALDAYDGRRIAAFELPPTQRFASTALVASPDRIAIARKGYDDKDAALVLLRLIPPPPRVPPGPVPYNGDSPVKTGPSGR